MVKVIELKTTQSPAIRTLTDTLNSLLTDINITFYPNNPKQKSDSNEEQTEEDSEVNKVSQNGGVVIKEVNKTVTVLVYCKLDGFEEYSYNYHKNKLMIGVKLPNLLKCLKCIFLISFIHSISYNL